MWWVIFPLKKYTVLFYTELKCIVCCKKCRWEEEEHQQAADVIQHVPGLFQSPPTSPAKDTSPGMTGWNRFKKQTNNQKNNHMHRTLCESFNIRWCFLVGRMSQSQNKWSWLTSWWQTGLVEPQKPEQLSSDCFPLQNGLCCLSSWKHTVLKSLGGSSAAAGVVVSHLPSTIVTVPVWSRAAMRPDRSCSGGQYETM